MIKPSAGAALLRRSRRACSLRTSLTDVKYPSVLEARYRASPWHRHLGTRLSERANATLKSVWIVRHAVMPSRGDDPGFDWLLAKSLAFAFLSKAFLLAMPLCLKLGVNTLAAQNYPFALAAMSAFSASYLLSSLFDGRRRELVAELFNKSWYRLARETFALRLRAERRGGAVTSKALEGARVALQTNFGIFFNNFVNLALEIAFALLMVQTQCGSVLSANIIGCTGAYVWATRRGEAAAARVGESERGRSASEFVEDALKSPVLLRLFNAVELKLAQFARLSASRLEAVLRREAALSRLYARQKLVLSVAVLSNAWIIIERVKRGLMSAGDLAFINTLALLLFTPLFNFSVQRRVYLDTFAPLAALLGSLHGAEEEARAAPARPFVLARGDIEFRGVRVVDASRQRVIDRASFRVPGGSLVMVTGAGGQRKDLLFEVMLRAHEVAEGQVLLDGQDLQGLEGGYRAHFAYLPHRHFFINDSILNNLFLADPQRYFRRTHHPRADFYAPDAHYEPRHSGPDERIIALVEEFGLTHKIEALEGRYDFAVGENGQNLTGGERQQLSLVRMFLRDTDIYLFDQPTSFLDRETESRFYEKLLQLRRAKKTAVVLTHNFLIAPACDYILCVDADARVEFGSHAELYLRRGKYWSLYSAFENFDFSALDKGGRAP